MSTHYRILNKHVSVLELFDGRLERFGIVEDPESENTDANTRWLTDGRNFLAVNGTKEVSFTRWMRNGSPSDILNAIAEAFVAEIVSEHEAQYWGFDTDEDWEAWLERVANERTQRVHVKSTEELLRELGR